LSPFENYPTFLKAKLAFPKEIVMLGVRLSCALLIIDSSARLSGEIGIVKTAQQAELLPNRSGIKQFRLPQGRGLSWKPRFPGGTGLQSRSIFFRRSFHQHKTIRYSTSGRHGAANPSGLAASDTMSGTQN
jgi:hypothetical protein